MDIVPSAPPIIATPKNANQSFLFNSKNILNDRIKKIVRTKTIMVLSRNTTKGTGKEYRFGLKRIPSIPHNDAAKMTKKGANLFIYKNTRLKSAMYTKKVSVKNN